MDSEPEFAARYREFPDLQLMELAEAQADLMEPALAALRAEFAQRGLRWPKPNPKKVETPAQRYARMSNYKLRELARWYEELGEEERAGLRGEFEERGLEVPLIEDDSSGSTEEDPESAGESGEESATGADKWVTVRAYRDLADALVARCGLEQAEIPCFLRDEHTVGINWGWSNLLGGAKLQVPERYVEAAEAVLSQPIPAEFATDGGEYVQPVCPKCGSLNVMADDLDRKLKLTGTLASGLPMIACLPALALVKKGAWKCLQCGCRWIEDGADSPEVPDGA
jgi:predicted nucleic-acid-binding Zn-ribbon protein